MASGLNRQGRTRASWVLYFPMCLSRWEHDSGAAPRAVVAMVTSLKRDPQRVRDDVVDDYVSVERARKDYGVVLKVVDEDLAEYEIDEAATRAERRHIAANRKQWLEEDPEQIAARFRAGQIDMYDVIRQHGVICDWGNR